MLLSAYRGIVALLTFAFVAYLFHGMTEMFAGRTSSFQEYLDIIANNLLLKVTVADFYYTLALSCLMISVFERKWWAGILAYIPAVFIGGPLVGLYLLWRLPAFLRAVGVKIDRDPEANSEPDDEL